jgi:hypothetical protein
MSCRIECPGELKSGSTLTIQPPRPDAVRRGSPPTCVSSASDRNRNSQAGFQGSVTMIAPSVLATLAELSGTQQSSLTVAMQASDMPVGSGYRWLTLFGIPGSSRAAWSPECRRSVQLHTRCTACACLSGKVPQAARAALSRIDPRGFSKGRSRYPASARRRRREVPRHLALRSWPSVLRSVRVIRVPASVPLRRAMPCRPRP